MAGKRVLFAGDINVDVMMGGMESLPMVDREVTCRTFDVVMGASTVLCACAYASLGGQVSFSGLAGHDDYGDFMVAGLENFGIDTSLVTRTHAVRTGVTVNLIYQSTRTQVTYAGTIAEFKGERLIESALRNFDHLHCAGVYLQTEFRPRIAEVLETARKLGLTTSLDPQWDSTEKWEGLADWLPLLSYFFVNEGEAQSITGKDSPEAALVALSERTACPVVKVGKQGVLVMADGRPRTVPTRTVEVIDTTGAGDSFDAGFLFATLEKHMPLADAAAFGTAVATRSCMFVGGVNARSSYADIVEFMKA